MTQNIPIDYNVFKSKIDNSPIQLIIKTIENFENKK